MADPISRRRKKELDSPAVSPTTAPLAPYTPRHVKVTYSPRSEAEIPRTPTQRQEIPPISSTPRMKKKQSTDTIVNERYRVLEIVGCGSFGSVYRAQDIENNTYVALKILDLESAPEEISELQQEIAIQAGCNNKRIAQYIDSFVRRHKLFIVMEFLGGGSGRDLLKPGPLSEEYVAIVMRETLLALDYLHDSGKIHRDIKAANILFSDKGRVKLGDFGVAAQLNNLRSVRNTFVGTPFWMAPEVIETSDYNHKADIWSLGITAIEFATGDPPLSKLNPMKVLLEIPKLDAPTLPEGVGSDLFRDFLSRCLVKDQFARASAKELLTHPFIRNAGKTFRMTEMIDRKIEYEMTRPHFKKGTPTVHYHDTMTSTISAVSDHWNFDTVKPNHGTMRAMPQEPRTVISDSRRDAAPKKKRSPIIITTREIEEDNIFPYDTDSSSYNSDMAADKPSKVRDTNSRTHAQSEEEDDKLVSSRQKANIIKVLQEVAQNPLAQHEQLVMKQLCTAWENLSVICPSLEACIIEKLAQCFTATSASMAPARKKASIPNGAKERRHQAIKPLHINSAAVMNPETGHPEPGLPPPTPPDEATARYQFGHGRKTSFDESAYVYAPPSPQESVQLNNPNAHPRKVVTPKASALDRIHRHSKEYADGIKVSTPRHSREYPSDFLMATPRRESVSVEQLTATPLQRRKSYLGRRRSEDLDLPKAASEHVKTTPKLERRQTTPSTRSPREIPVLGRRQSQHEDYSVQTATPRRQSFASRSPPSESMQTKRRDSHVPIVRYEDDKIRITSPRSRTPPTISSATPELSESQMITKKIESQLLGLWQERLRERCPENDLPMSPRIPRIHPNMRFIARP